MRLGAARRSTRRRPDPGAIDVQLRRRAGDGAAQARRPGLPARRRPGPERDRGGGARHADVRAPQQPARHRLRRPARHRPLARRCNVRTRGTETLAEQSDLERQVRAGDAVPRRAAEASLHPQRRPTSASSRRRSPCRTSTRCAPRSAPSADRPGRRFVRHPRRARVPCASSRRMSGAAVLDSASRRPTWRCPRASRPTARPRSTRCSPPARAEPACASAHPGLRARLAELLRSLPRTVDRAASADRPRRTSSSSRRDMVLGAVRSALYVPAFAAALPAAIDAAARGDFAGLAGLDAAFSSRQVDAARDRHAFLGRLRRRRAAACAVGRPAGRRLRRRVRALYERAVLGMAARRGARGVLRRSRRARRPCWC